MVLCHQSNLAELVAQQNWRPVNDRGAGKGFVASWKDKHASQTAARCVADTLPAVVQSMSHRLGQYDGAVGAFRLALLAAFYFSASHHDFGRPRSQARRRAISARPCKRPGITPRVPFSCSFLTRRTAILRSTRVGCGQAGPCQWQPAPRP